MCVCVQRQARSRSSGGMEVMGNVLLKRVKVACFDMGEEGEEKGILAGGDGEVVV